MDPPAAPPALADAEQRILSAIAGLAARLERPPAPATLEQARLALLGVLFDAPRRSLPAADAGERLRASIDGLFGRALQHSVADIAAAFPQTFAALKGGAVALRVAPTAAAVRGKGGDEAGVGAATQRAEYRPKQDASLEQAYGALEKVLAAAPDNKLPVDDAEMRVRAALRGHRIPFRFKTIVASHPSEVAIDGDSVHLLGPGKAAPPQDEQPGKKRRRRRKNPAPVWEAVEPQSEAAIEDDLERAADYVARLVAASPDAACARAVVGRCLVQQGLPNLRSLLAASEVVERFGIVVAGESLEVRQRAEDES